MWPWSALAPRHGVAVVALEALQGTSAVRVAVAVPRANRHALRRRHVLLHRRSDLAEACAAEQRGSRSRHRPSTRGPSWHSVAIADTTDTAVTTYAGIPAPADTHSLVMVRVRWCTWLCAGAAGAWEVAGKEARGQRPARHCVTTPPSHDHLSPRARVSRKLGGGATFSCAYTHGEQWQLRWRCTSLAPRRSGSLQHALALGRWPGVERWKPGTAS